MEPHENMGFWNQVSLEGLVVEMGDEGPGQRDMESRSLKHMQILRSIMVGLCFSFLVYSIVITKYLPPKIVVKIQ